MTTTYTFDQLKEDVRKEAEALRVHATAEERGRLDIKELDPSGVTDCIYGQMTGCCYSRRAALLIHKSCVQFFANGMLPDMEDDNVDMERIRSNVNGKKVKGFVKARTNLEGTHYSAIEAYILLPEAKNENLIAFIKGETDNLEL